MGLRTKFNLVMVSAFLIGLAIFAQSPGYYLEVKDNPVFLPVLGGLFVWAIIGNLIMIKMINFKY